MRVTINVFMVNKQSTNLLTSDISIKASNNIIYYTYTINEY